MQVSQRIAVLWTFLALVGLWASQTILHATTVWEARRADRVLSMLRDSTLCLQWSSVSFLALLLLYLLQIPKLRFDFRRFVVLAMAAVSLQMLVFLPGSPLSMRALVDRSYNWYHAIDYIPQIVSVQENLSDKELESQLDSHHILGSFTVKIIPYSSAELNPDGARYCVRLKRPSSLEPIPRHSVRIPVLLVGVPPWTLEYVTSDASTDQETTHSVEVTYEAEDPAEDSFFKKMIPPSKGDEEAKRQWYMLEVDRPGMVRLQSLQDVKGPGAVSKSLVGITVCPEAFWKRSTLEEDAISPDVAINEKIKPIQQGLCLAENSSVSALVYGSPPLSFTYFRKIGRKQLSNITITNVDETYLYPDIRALRSSKAFQVNLDLGSFETAKPYEYFITKVTDADGHATEYTERVDSDQITFDVMERYATRGGLISMNSNRPSRPTARLSCNANTHLEVIASEEDLLQARPGNSIQVAFTGRSPPFEFSYAIRKLDGSELVRTVKDVAKSPYSLPVDYIGTYKLLSVTDAACAGTVDASECTSVKLFPPTVEIRSKVIETPCFGQIGLSFDLKLTGNGPWTVWYDLVYQKGKPQRKSALLSKPTDHIEIKPPNPGIYTVTFVQLQDSRYPEPIKIEGVSATQLFHAPSSVSLESYDRHLCLGELSEIKLRLAGSGPWSLSYDIISGSARSSHSLENVKESSLRFSTPALLEPGMHYVELKSVRDANGCTTDLRLPGIQIEVYDSRPTAVFHPEGYTAADAAFSDRISMKMVSGQWTFLPVHLSGQAPFTLEVEFSEDEGASWRKLAPFSIDRPDGKLKTAKPGIYRLVSVKDRVCSGQIQAPNHCYLTTISQPLASIRQIKELSFQTQREKNFEDVAVCQSEKVSVGFHVEGKAPYVLGYQVDYDPCPSTVFKGSKCRTITESKTFSSSQQDPSLDMATDLAGDYVYSLKTVSDDYYSKVALSGDDLSFRLRVHPHPNIYIPPMVLTQHLCLHSPLPSSQGVRLELDGTGPWLVDYDFSADSAPLHAPGSAMSTTEKLLNSATLTIPSSPYYFRPPDGSNTFSDVGRYRYRIRKVTDSNGCFRVLTEHETADPILEIVVSPQPSLSLMGASRVDERSISCAGEVVEIVVQGTPPFRMEYAFEANGTVQTKTLDLDDHANSIFRSIRDIKLFDHEHVAVPNAIAKKVGLRFMEEGVLTLKQICHGKSEQCCRTLEDVQQHFVYGNETRVSVEFRGHPPFSFTYVRRTESGIELESHTLTDIMDHHYELTIAQAGTFKITYIGDRYCRYPSTHVRRT